MAAPSTVIWGPIKGDYVRLGLNVTTSTTDDKYDVIVDIWVKTKYSMDEEHNTLYYDCTVDSGKGATGNHGSVSIQTSVATGAAWNTANEVKVKTFTYSYIRGTTNVKKHVFAKITDVIKAGSNGTITAETSFTIPKLASYTIGFDPNGGTGSLNNITKYYDIDVTLPSGSLPTKTGYTFQGWATSKTATSAVYRAGSNYTANSGATLYAIWQANTYTITYDANGGTLGSVTRQTKTYGQTLTLTGTATRTNYNFLGWSTDKNASTATYTTSYATNTTANVTLYAVWALAYVRPRINGLSVFRVIQNTDEEGNVTYIPSDTGTYAGVVFDWACDQTVSSIVIEWKSVSTEAQSVTYTTTELSGSTSVVIGDGGLATDATYTITVTVTDANDYSEVYATLPGTKFWVDIRPKNAGIAFGKPAELDGVADFGYAIKPSEGFVNIPIPENTDLNNLTTPNTYISYDKVASTYLNCPITGGTFTLEVTSAGNEGQVAQTFTSTSKDKFCIWKRFYHSTEGVMSWGEWKQEYSCAGNLLWDASGTQNGGYYMNETQTVTLSQKVSEQPTGIVLVFCAYDTENKAAKNYWYSTHFVPKKVVSLHSGVGHSFLLVSSAALEHIGIKYLYIHDDKITGNTYNADTGTANGISYANNKFVLRYVIGV